MTKSKEEITREIVMRGFPEPFRSAVLHRKDAEITFMSKNAKDHDYLNSKGYKCKMLSDCSFCVEGLPNLKPSSYGNWGTIYDCSIDDKSFQVFCEMYKNGVVSLWKLDGKHPYDM